MHNGTEESQINAQEVRGTRGEDRGIRLEGSEGRVIQHGERSKSFVQRIDGEAGEEGNSFITGGIITQLVKQAERRLGNAVACIDWYERERAEALQELQELRQLATLIKTGDASTTEAESPGEEPKT